MGDHPSVHAGRRPRHRGAGRREAARGGVAARRTARVRRTRRWPHRGPAAGGAVPAGARAGVRGTRRRDAARGGRRRDRAGVLGRGGRRGDRRHRGGVRRPRRLRHRRRGVRQARRGDHPRRDRAGRGREPRHRPALPRDRRRLGSRQGADRAQAAARAGARRLLDLPLLHRRPLPGRREPGAARLDPQRRRPDEPDQRHLPAAHRAGRRPGRRAARVPARREGDLRAVHGGGRRAQDDVRHLPRGRSGARALPQADEPADPHRVPPRRAHRPRPARGAARHDVRRHGHRLPGRERLPADQAVRDRGPRLLRRRAGGAGPRRPGRPGRGQPDRDPHR